MEAELSTQPRDPAAEIKIGPDCTRTESEADSRSASQTPSLSPQGQKPGQEKRGIISHLKGQTNYNFNSEYFQNINSGQDFSPKRQ